MYFGRSFWSILNSSYRFTVGPMSVTHISYLSTVGVTVATAALSLSERVVKLTGSG